MDAYDVWKQSHPKHIGVYRQEERREASDRRRYHRAQRRLSTATRNETP